MKKAIIIDDDLQFKINGSLLELFSDETSPDFEIIDNFVAEKTGKKQTEDEILHFINSSEFVDEYVLNPEFIEKFEGESKLILEAFHSDISKQKEKFSLIENTLIKNNYQVDKCYIRPKDSSDLNEYEVIFMDFYMGDGLDDVDSLAEYFNKIENEPLLFLISSRPELNDVKSKFRERAKISSLSFSILHKEVFNDESSGLKIDLTLNQMVNSREEAKNLKSFIDSLELAHVDAFTKVKTILWNLDYSFLQKLKSMTDNESSSFSEQLYTLINNNITYHLENTEKLNDSIQALESNLKKNNKLACFSNSSEIYAHELESTLFIKGILPTVKKIKKSDINWEHDNFSEVIPYGVIILDKTNNNVMVHCTQQCDLSRNVLKDKLNLLFLCGELVNDESKKGDNSIPIPHNIKSSVSWINISDKNLLSIPHDVCIKMLDSIDHECLAILRDDVVRQYRSHVLSNISRIEKPVSSGDFLKVSLSIDRRGQETLIFKDGIDILLNEFSTNKKQTYHLIEQRHIDVIHWIMTSTNLSEFGIDHHKLEKILKEELPSFGKSSNYAKDKFIIELNKDKKQSPQGDQIVFRMTKV